mmetsp:Transcript_13262/g.31381  ORF Transcript_13262/g.31381 Transcript_13262/m.31381 type:complete len:319 (+) Transcript_13262:1990-2946(+)
MRGQEAAVHRRGRRRLHLVQVLELDECLQGARGVAPAEAVNRGRPELVLALLPLEDLIHVEPLHRGEPRTRPHRPRRGVTVGDARGARVFGHGLERGHALLAHGARAEALGQGLGLGHGRVVVLGVGGLLELGQLGRREVHVPPGVGRVQARADPGRLLRLREQVRWPRGGAAARVNLLEVPGPALGALVAHEGPRHGVVLARPEKDFPRLAEQKGLAPGLGVLPANAVLARVGLPRRRPLQDGARAAAPKDFLRVGRRQLARGLHVRRVRALVEQGFAPGPLARGRGVDQGEPGEHDPEPAVVQVVLRDGEDGIANC